MIAMMFLKLALTVFLATNASAFFVSPAPRPFVSRYVSLSDPSTSSEVQPKGEAPEDATEATMEVAAPTEGTVVEESAEVLQKPPVKNTERHTLYVGNLPYGKCDNVPYIIPFLLRTIRSY